MKNKLKTIVLLFTRHCNLKCIHCAHNDLNLSKDTELSTDFFVQVLAEAKNLGAKNVSITGGEIFTRPDCMDLIERMVNLGYLVTLESNGTLISDNQLERLKLFGKKITLVISLDGITENTHDSIRGGKSFLKTVDVLKKAAAMKINTRINTVLQKSNINEVAKIASFALNELHIKFRLVPNILEHGGGACNKDLIEVGYNQVQRKLKKDFFPLLLSNEKKVSIGLNVALMPIESNGGTFCYCAHSMLGIGPNGIVSLCHISNSNSNFYFGDLKTTSITDIWENSERIKDFRKVKPSDLHGVCGNCLANKICRGGCRVAAITKYGDFLAPDPQCQEVYNLGKFPKYAIENSQKKCFYGI